MSFRAFSTLFLKRIFYDYIVFFNPEIAPQEVTLQQLIFLVTRVLVLSL